jgi:hypothetical protein
MEQRVIEAIQDLANKTDAVNKRLTITVVVALVAIAIMTLSWCIRDTIIAHQYFGQTINQEVTKDKAIIRFEGGNTNDNIRDQGGGEDH